MPRVRFGIVSDLPPIHAPTDGPEHPKFYPSRAAFSLFAISASSASACATARPAYAAGAVRSFGSMRCVIVGLDNSPASAAAAL